MINLLPTAIKSNYIYGRRNVLLRRWVAACVIALVGFGGLATYGLVSLRQSTAHYNEQIKATEKSFVAQDFDGTQKQVQNISNSFKLVVQVLGQEVLFSQLIKQIGAAIPANTRLTALEISQTKGGIDITADAKNYDTATQVQLNLADPRNRIFSRADIVSITCSPVADGQQYPCVVTIRALFADDNPFLFINSKAVKTP